MEEEKALRLDKYKRNRKQKVVASEQVHINKATSINYTNKIVDNRRNSAPASVINDNTPPSKACNDVKIADQTVKKTESVHIPSGSSSSTKVKHVVKRRETLPAVSSSWDSGKPKKIEAAPASVAQKDSTENIGIKDHKPRDPRKDHYKYKNLSTKTRKEDSKTSAVKPLSNKSLQCRQNSKELSSSDAAKNCPPKTVESDPKVTSVTKINNIIKLVTKVGIQKLTEVKFSNCTYLSRYQFPVLHKAASAIQENESCDQAVTMENVDVNTTVQVIRQDVEDDVIEVVSIIPVIDLTDDVDKDEAKDIKSDVDNKLPLEPEEMITLYRSEETVNDSLDVQVTSESISSEIMKNKQIGNDRRQNKTTSEESKTEESNITNPVLYVVPLNNIDGTDGGVAQISVLQNTEGNQIATSSSVEVSLKDLLSVHDSVTTTKQNVTNPTPVDSRQDSENLVESNNRLLSALAKPPQSKQAINSLTDVLKAIQNSVEAQQNSVPVQQTINAHQVKNSVPVQQPLKKSVRKPSVKKNARQVSAQLPVQQPTINNQYTRQMSTQLPVQQPQHASTNQYVRQVGTRLPVQQPQPTPNNQYLRQVGTQLPVQQPSTGATATNLYARQVTSQQNCLPTPETVPYQVQSNVQQNPVPGILNGLQRRLDDIISSSLPVENRSYSYSIHSPMRHTDDDGPAPLHEISIDEIQKVGAILTTYLFRFDSLRRADFAYSKELQKALTPMPSLVRGEMNQFEAFTRQKYRNLCKNLIRDLKKLNTTARPNNDVSAQVLLRFVLRNVQRLAPTMTPPVFYLMMKSLMQGESAEYVAAPFLKDLYVFVDYVTSQFPVPVQAPRVQQAAEARPVTPQDPFQPNQRKLLEWQIQTYHALCAKQRRLLNELQNASNWRQTFTANARAALAMQPTATVVWQNTEQIPGYQINYQVNASQTPANPNVTVHQNIIIKPSNADNKAQQSCNQVPSTNNAMASSMSDGSKIYKIRLPYSAPYGATSPREQTVIPCTCSETAPSVVRTPSPESAQVQTSEAAASTATPQVQDLQTALSNPTLEAQTLEAAPSTQKPQEQICEAAPSASASTPTPDNAAPASPTGVPREIKEETTTASAEVTSVQVKEERRSDEVIDIIDLTWINDIDPVQLEAEIKYVTIKKEESDDEVDEEEVGFQEDQFSVAPSPADSGISSPPMQVEYDEILFTNRSCICGKNADYVCGCMTAMYCSRACQMTDWNSHKDLCLAHKKTANKFQQEGSGSPGHDTENST